MTWTEVWKGWILSKFANGTKLRGAVAFLEGRKPQQRHLDKSEGWVITSHMKFEKGKCWILYLGWSNPGYMDRLENAVLENSAAERGLGSWSMES